MAFDRIMTEPGWGKNTLAKCLALKQKLEHFELSFLLGVFQSIFGLTELVFQVLQCKTADIIKCQDDINSTISTLKATRTNKTFTGIYDGKVEAVGEPMPRCKRRHRRWEDLVCVVVEDLKSVGSSTTWSLIT